MNGYKLYEHIRLGAMLAPQGRGSLLWRGKACALGAAAQSAGITLKDEQYPTSYLFLEAVFPFLAANSQYVTIIWWKNDGGDTREDIAAWLEPIEEAWWAKQESADDLAEATEVRHIHELVGD